MVSLKEQKTIKLIHALESGLYKSKQNSNNIAKLIEYCEARQDAVVFAAMKALQNVFTRLAAKNELQPTLKPTPTPTPESASKKRKVDVGNEGSAENVFLTWLLQMFDLYKSKLLENMVHKEGGIRVPALHCLFEVAKISASIETPDEPILPKDLIKSIIEKLVTIEDPSDVVIDEYIFQYISKYDDVKYMTLWSLGRSEILTKQESNEQHPYPLVTQRLLHTCQPPSTKPTSFFITPPDHLLEEEGEGEEGMGDEDDEDDEAIIAALTDKKRKLPEVTSKKRIQWPKIVGQIEAYRRLFSSAWIKFLSFKLPPATVKLALTKIEVIMDNMSSPLTLMDFLNNCYDMGGVYSVLALNGIFIQITKFNLDFPNFYKRLYKLFDEGVLHSKYRNKFFQLANRFMRSNYLPSYTAAAFVKKLLRHALNATPSGALLALAFSYNVLQHHRAAQVIIHRTPSDSLLNNKKSNGPILLVKTGASDDYKPDEVDPSKCNAINSSLWELKAFLAHECPEVVELARLFEGRLARQTFEIEDITAYTYQSLFEGELKRSAHGNPVSFAPKHTLFDSDDKFDGWSLSDE